MNRDEPIESIMSPNVIGVEVKQKLSDVRALMAKQDVSHVPVVRGRKLVGMISATDLLRLDSPTGTPPDHDPSIEAVMKTDLVTLREYESIQDAARHLRSGQFHALPIVDHEGALLGLVTSTDLIRYLYDRF